LPGTASFTLALQIKKRPVSPLPGWMHCFSPGGRRTPLCHSSVFRWLCSSLRYRLGEIPTTLLNILRKLE